MGRLTAAPSDVVPWLDQPAPVPGPARSVIGHQLVWEHLDSVLTPFEEFFTVQHYGQPAVSPQTWRLSVGGLVAEPLVLTLAVLQGQPRREVEYTLECSGNHGLPFFTGGIGNAVWAGTQLRRLLRRARPLPTATEVVFWGADRGPVTVRDDSGITGSGRTGTGTPDAGGGIDLGITERFARSTSLEDAMAPDNLLCDRMDGVALPAEHGGPVRLIAPGWYGVANVKWLTHIELTSGRFAGRFMARDYVSIREEQRAGGPVWTFQTVGGDRLKPAPARVLRTGSSYAVTGVAWGAPIARVEVQVDEGAWRPARLRRRLSGAAEGYAWRAWTFDWSDATPGTHTVCSRAVHTSGAVQPSEKDPYLSSRVTSWEANGHVARRVLLT